MWRANFLILHVKINGMQSFVYWSTLKALLEKVCYMVIITILKSFFIQILIGQDLHLIEDQLSIIVFPSIITWSLGKVRNKVLWRDLVHKKNIELWSRLLVSLFVLNSYLKNCKLEKSIKWYLYLIIRLLFILVEIQFFMKGPNILRLIVISFEKILYREISRLRLLIQIIN